MSNATLPAQRDSDSYQTRNEELFDYRQQLQEALKEARGGARPAIVPARVRDRHVVRWIEREIEEAHTALYVENQPLVISYAGRFTAHTTSDNRDDFVAAGMVGLAEGIERFDPRLGRLSTLAFRPIQRGVTHAFRMAEYETLSTADFEHRPAINHARTTLTEQLGRCPTEEEIAARAKVPLRQVQRVLASRTKLSLDVPSPDSGQSLADRLDDGARALDETVHVASQLDALGEVLSELSDRERYVIERSFGLRGEDPANLPELGEELGYTRETIRQTKAKALAKLNHPCVLARIVRA